MESLVFKSFATPRRLASIAFTLASAAAPVARAQSAADHLATGDRDHASMNPSGAMRHYEEVLKTEPASYEALWKATREAVDLGEATSDEKERDRLYAIAEQYARRAVEANPGDAEGHGQLARALGRKALSLRKRDQVRYAGDVRNAALDALKLVPKHALALHVMGMWNYNVLRLSGLTRLVARTFLGGKVFDSANWDDAQKYMEESVAAEPARLVHHLDLGRVYAARGARERAREQFEMVAQLPGGDFNDRRYKAEAMKELAALR